MTVKSFIVQAPGADSMKKFGGKFTNFVQHFSLELRSWLNKLECYIKRGWKDFPVANILTYWACL